MGTSECKQMLKVDKTASWHSICSYRFQPAQRDTDIGGSLIRLVIAIDHQSQLGGGDLRVGIGSKRPDVLAQMCKNERQDHYFRGKQSE